MTGLVFGSLDLMGGGAIQLEALGTDSGTDWGNPGPIETQLNSFLQYGALVASEGYENRTVMVAVSVQGTGPVRAAAEAALAGEIRKRNVLLYTPPGSTVVTRFEVLTSSFDQVPNDLLEVANGERIYMLRLVCLPFAFSANETITPALPATGTTSASVDDMSSTTNWTGSSTYQPSITPTTSGGALSVTSDSAAGRTLTNLTRTANITTATTKYLVIDWRANYANLRSWSLLARINNNASYLSKVSEEGSPTAGYTRTTFLVGSESTVTTITFSLDSDDGLANFGVPGTARTLTLDQLTRTDIKPAKPKQQLLTLNVGGSMPTTGSLAISHSSAGLGEVIAYSTADDGSGYQPSSRQYALTGGGNPTAVSDANATSGLRTELAANALMSIDVPNRLLPDGDYLVMPSVNSGVNPISGWVAIAGVNGNTVVPSNQPVMNFSAPATGSAGIYAFVRAGLAHLPTFDSTNGNTAVTKFQVKNTGANTMYFDDLLLYNLTTGDLSQFSCGTGTPTTGAASNRLWIDSPSVENDGLGRYLRGTAADRSDAQSATVGSTAVGIHEFPAGPTKLHVTTTGTPSAVDVALRHRKAWMFTAGE